MTTSLIAADLIEACKQPGCPFCRLTQRGVRHYLNGLFYEKVNNVELRQHLRDSLGFCREHAWLAFEPGVGDVLGGAIIYEDVIKNVLRRLDEAQAGSQGGLSSLLPGRRSPGGRGKALARALQPRDRCLVCVHQEELDELHIMTLLSALKRENMQQALADSDGFCLYHLRLAMDSATDDQSLDRVLAASHTKLEQLKEELGELIRKFDYRFSQESYGGERDAWFRALRLAAGEPVQKNGT